MPTETIPHVVRFTQSSVYWDTRQGGPYPFSSSDTTSVDGNNTRLLNSNPNWRQQVARKQDATTDYSRVTRTSVPCRLYGESDTPYFSFGKWWHYYGRNLVSFVDGAQLISDSEDTALRDIALARLKRRLSDKVGDWSAMAPVAELRETRGLLTGLAHSATGVVRALIDIKRTRGKSAYKYASEAWLTWSFGVKPLLADIKKANESIEAYLLRNDVTLKLSGSANKKWISGLRSNGHTGAYNAPYSRLFRAEHELSYRYASGMNLKLKSGNNYGVDDHFGLELKALPSTAWELVPFSWVVDYFTTAGAYFEDTFEMPPGSLKYLMLQRRYKMICYVEGVHVPISGTVMSTDQSHGGLYTYINFSRTKLSSLPFRSLRFKTADEIGKSAVNKLLNLASVLGSSSRLRR